MTMLREQVANQWRSPQYCFSHRVTEINTCANTYFQAHTPQDLDKVNVHTAMQFYRQCFRDPAAFTLILVGNFDQAELPALLTQYLAAIPAIPKIPRGDVAGAPPHTTGHTNREGDAATGNGGAQRGLGGGDGSGSAALPDLPHDREGIKSIDVCFPAKGVAETLSKWMVDPLCCTQMTFPLEIEASDTELKESMLLGHAMQVLEPYTQNPKPYTQNPKP